MAEATTPDANYTTDYSQYYLDFAASLGDFTFEDFGPSDSLTDPAVPNVGTGGTGTRPRLTLREAARVVAGRRGISVKEARAYLDRHPKLRRRLMSGGGNAMAGGGQTYGDVISGLGLADGLFQPLIDKAIRNGWSAERLRAMIIQSPTFDALFPGIKRPDGSLRMSALEYRQLADSYTSIAKEFGVTLSRTRVGLLVEGAVSPQEFTQRVMALDKVRTNAGLREAFNQEISQFGLKPLNEMDWFKFVAGVGSKDYYDVYEAAQLKSSGLNIDAATAKTVAQNIGDAGAPLDIQGLVSEARTMLADIGPELLREGISDADLVQMAAGYDPRGLEPKLRTIIANRRATGKVVLGSRATSSGEGTTVFTPEAPVAY